MITTGTATNGTDHTTIPVTVTILAGTTGTTFNVTSLQDLIIEGTEYTDVVISSTTGSNSSVGIVNFGQVTIMDDETAPVVNLT